MFRYLIERIMRVMFDVVLRFCRNPKIELSSLNLKFKHEGDLSRISKQYGIRLETLRQQKDTGLDNPAYRFHRDEGFLSYFASHAEVLKGCSWLDVGAGTGVVSLYLSEVLGSTNFELCDVDVARRSNFPVRQIAGTHLDPLEEWIETKVGASRCTSVCGDSDCRTVEVNGNPLR